MNNAELGRRLKEARLAKKMTQSDVVGNFITRNMLSQIESGNAAPSMKTLEYLAGVLEIPMDRLLAERQDTACPDASDLLRHAKALLHSGDYEKLLAIQDESGMLEDELHAMRSIAHLEIATLLKNNGNPEDMQQAVLHAKSAAQEAAAGIYANETRQAQANHLISEIAQFLSSYYSSLANAGV